MNEIVRTYRGCIIIGKSQRFKIKVLLFGEYEEINGTYKTIQECKNKIDKLCKKLRSN